MLLPVILTATVICAGIVLYRYYRVQRIAAGIGWAILIFAIGGFGSGLAESFDWAGFVFLFIGAVGAMIIAQEAWFRRQARRKRDQTHRYDFEH